MPDLNDRALQLVTVDRPTIALDFGTGFTDAWLNSIGMAYLFLSGGFHLAGQRATRCEATLINQVLRGIRGSRAGLLAVMLMPSYIGVKLVPGDHTVRMEYRPRPLRGILLVASLFVLALIALVERHRERISLWLTGLISDRLAALRKG